MNCCKLWTIAQNAGKLRVLRNAAFAGIVDCPLNSDRIGLGMATYSSLSRTRRRWPWILIILLLIVGGLWTALWNYAAAKVETTIAGWREREAKVGRVYACAEQTIGGFPFQIDVKCSDPSAEFRTTRPATALKWKDLHVTASVFTPTRLVAELTGPMLIGEPGSLPSYSATWKQATIVVRGLPREPERITLTADDPKVERAAGGGNELVFKALSLEITGRMVEGSAMNNPVIEVALVTKDAAAPTVHPGAAIPLDADVTVLLRGLKDFSPKTWAARFREIQAANGRLEVTKARVRQVDSVAVANGALSLTPRGRLDGELRVTVANYERVLTTFGLDRMLSQATAQGGQLDSAIGALDRLIPGLGNVARQNAGPVAVAGIGLLGQPAELEGKRAVMMPLKFNDGNVTLGPIPLGPTPPLF
jgi:hypothetical protein